jgi:hypothetical protein
VYLIGAYIFEQFCDTIYNSKRDLGFKATLLIILYSFIFSLSYFGDLLITAIFLVYSNFVFSILCYKCKWHFAFINSVIATVVMIFCDVGTPSLFSVLIPDFYEKDLQFSNFVAINIVSIISYYIILHFLSLQRKIQKLEFKFLDDIIIVMYVIPALSYFITLTLCTISIVSNPSGMVTILISCSALLMVIICLTAGLFYTNIISKNRKLTKLRIQAQKDYDDTQYFKMVNERDERQRILIHDIKKHLHSIMDLLDSTDNNDAIEYINTMLKSNELKNSVRFCDNNLLNSILARYSKTCAENNISLNVDIRKGLLSFLKFEDMTAIFSNLLENAIDACGNCDNSFIDLSITRKSSTNLILVDIVNSCKTIPLTDAYGQLITTKSNTLNHGYGMKSVTNAISNYNGNMQFHFDPTTFTFHTIITLLEP